MIWQISWNKILDVLPAFACARVIVNIWSICLGVYILSPSPWNDACSALDALEE